VPLLALSLFLGFFPKPVFDRMELAVEDLMAHIETTTGYAEPDTPTPEAVTPDAGSTNGHDEGGAGGDE
jgi:hypothetical protein